MIKAIPTVYKGIEFRSKLEAQWAATLDVLEVPWLYEVEGYQLSDGTRYLPDFYLPDSDQFFEVKGVMTDKDMHKIEQLSKDSGKDVVIGYPDGHVQMWQWQIWCNSQMYGRQCDEDCDECTDCAKDSDFVLANSMVLAKCKSCGKQWFMSEEGFWECKCCGEYDGDHHLVGWIENRSVYEAYLEAPDAYKSYIMAAFRRSFVKIIPKG
jgi:hypothetical protein